MKPLVISRMRDAALLAALAGLFAVLAPIPNSVFAQEEAKDSQQRITIEIDESGAITVNGEVLGPDDDIGDLLSEDQRADVDIVVTEDGKRVITINGGDIVIGGRGGSAFRRHGAPKGFFFRDDDDGEAAVWFGDDLMGRLNMARFGEGLGVAGEFPGGIEIGGPGGLRFFGGDEISAEVMHMEAKSRRLAQRLRRSDPDDRVALDAELDSLLDEIFDMKQALRQEALAKQQKHVAEEQNALEQRRRNRSDIIARRKAQLLGHSDW